MSSVNLFIFEQHHTAGPFIVGKKTIGPLTYTDYFRVDETENGEIRIGVGGTAEGCGSITIIKSELNDIIDVLIDIKNG